MNKAEKALKEIQSMDELAGLGSVIHSLPPLSKLIVTIIYIVVTLSFSKYDLSGLTGMILYPVAVYVLSGISVITCFYKLRIVLPLVLAVGIFNPFFDRTPMMEMAVMGRDIIVTGGVISMITLIMKGVFCLMASFILVATTTIEEICLALRKLHTPKLIVSLILLTYRYVSLLLSEVATMTTAYSLRAPGQKGISYNVWGTFLGQLLLRTMDRATALYESMELRGFNGEFYYADKKHNSLHGVVYFIIWCIFIFTVRFVNIAEMIGRLLV